MRLVVWSVMARDDTTAAGDRITAQYHRQPSTPRHSMPTIDYSRFYRYDDLMALLRAFAAENPRLRGAGNDRHEPRRPRHPAA